MEPRFRLRELREDAGMSRSELARRLHVDRTYVWMIERGRRQPGLKLMLELARFFNCGLDDLLEGNMPGRD